jgi:hypothetical protein
LIHLFESTELEVVELDWPDGYFGTVAYQFMTMAKDLPWRKKQLGTASVKSLMLVLPVSIVLKPFLQNTKLSNGISMIST